MVANRLTSAALAAADRASAGPALEGSDPCTFLLPSLVTFAGIVARCDGSGASSTGAAPRVRPGVEKFFELEVSFPQQFPICPHLERDRIIRMRARYGQEEVRCS